VADALVLFFDDAVDGGEHWLSPLLKKGFRHCLCVVRADRYWVMIDAEMGLPKVSVIASVEFDIEEFYRDEDINFIGVSFGKRINRPVLLNNCVGMVKVMIGINAPFAVTPYQLFKYLGGKLNV
jgi:hypothetical protein